jgi:hypothetical protein
MSKADEYSAAMMAEVEKLEDVEEHSVDVGHALDGLLAATEAHHAALINVMAVMSKIGTMEQFDTIIAANRYLCLFAAESFKERTDQLQAFFNDPSSEFYQLQKGLLTIMPRAKAIQKARKVSKELALTCAIDECDMPEPIKDKVRKWHRTTAIMASLDMPPHALAKVASEKPLTEALQKLNESEEAPKL